MNNGGQAFPSPMGDMGMTLRDYFAIRLITKLMDRWEENGYSDDDAIVVGYKLADLMLTQRDKQG